MTMETAGAHELGYASAAIVRALLESLISKEVISSSDARSILDDAWAELGTLGRNQNVLGARKIVDQMRSHLGVR
jgi:hypothetical protein